MTRPLCLVVGLYIHEPVNLQLVEQRAGDGIGQRQLEHAALLFRHNAGMASVRKPTVVLSCMRMVIRKLHLAVAGF